MKTTGLRKVENTFRIFVMVALGIVFVAGLSCYRDYGLTTADYDMVLTLANPDAVFSNYSTYALPDTVIHPVPDGKQDDLTRDFDARIIGDVRRNMNALGYQEVDTSASNPPDVLVLLSAIKSDWQVSGWYPGGWWGWYPWYPGGGWYPWYPGYGYSYNFTTGTIFITMIDVANWNPDSPGDSPVWGAALNGLAGDTRSGTATRITNGLNQAFSQSPYLKIN
jgi:hypothetical protein